MICQEAGMTAPVMAVLGGTGHVGVSFISNFLTQGLQVRILARSPRRVAERFPGAQVVRGSMMEADDVRRVFEGADGAFLITPIGGNDDAGLEIRAAAAAITAAQITRLPHLILSSVIRCDHVTGVPLLDVKGLVERRLEASGLPWSALRTGCYMEDWLGFRPSLLRWGIYFFPIRSAHQFSFTSQRDVSRVAGMLLRQNRILYGSVDVIEPVLRTLDEVARLYGEHLGRTVVHAGGSWLPVLKMLRPVVLRWLKPVLASKVRLATYFDSHDWCGDPSQLAGVLPEFHVTSLERYLAEKHESSAITPGHESALQG